MDLNSAESIKSALVGVTHIIHVASPISSSEFQKYEDFVNPVIAGTKALVEACKEQRVKKLVVTSSCLCLMGDLNAKKEFDESDFTPLTNTDGYTDSKIQEEVILREFIDEQKGQ
eukprot:CAMPEP_0202980702 /NCGR_PEP_ID=MMETSP1396-20130829/86577_1 /ASSEMBLY_ACC=CAM_ASM_000872 /TAXON_ID= /ORGANISM="Pseudokeronopsis sp., Strain Brazil" /LENGTH=114 /DNA_ID=CAMNT_0049720841 /DNA_START=109 /DNA_END=453 /DNA_ORIENTATION=+